MTTIKRMVSFSIVLGWKALAARLVGLDYRMGHKLNLGLITNP